MAVFTLLTNRLHVWRRLRKHRPPPPPERFEAVAQKLLQDLRRDRVGFRIAQTVAALRMAALARRVPPADCKSGALLMGVLHSLNEGVDPSEVTKATEAMAKRG